MNVPATNTEPTGNMGMVTGASAYEIPAHECLDHLQAAQIGRICVLEQGYPIAFPVNFRVVGEGADVRIVIRTAPHTIIGQYRGNASLEVDDTDLESGSAWTVIARGMLRPRLGEVDAVDPHPLISTGRSLWMMLDVRAMSGRRFTVRPGRDDFSVDWQVERA